MACPNHRFSIAEFRADPLRVRFMDPTQGRFLGLDPYSGNQQNPLSFNKYLYCHGDPVNHSDPTGRTSDAEMISVSEGTSTLQSTLLPAIGRTFVNMLTPTPVTLSRWFLSPTLNLFNSLAIQFTTRLGFTWILTNLINTRANSVIDPLTTELMGLANDVSTLPVSGPGMAMSIRSQVSSLLNLQNNSFGPTAVDDALVLGQFGIPVSLVNGFVAFKQLAGVNDTIQAIMDELPSVISNQNIGTQAFLARELGFTRQTRFQYRLDIPAVLSAATAGSFRPDLDIRRLRLAIADLKSLRYNEFADGLRAFVGGTRLYGDLTINPNPRNL